MKRIILFLLLLVCLSNVTYGTLTDGIVSYWSFDDADTVGATAVDSLNLNNGTIVSATTGQTGKIGECYLFDSTNDYVYGADSVSMDMGDAVSISVWVNHTDTDYAYLLSKGSHYSPKTYDYSLAVDTNWAFVTGPDSASPVTVGSDTLNVWQFVVVTFNDTSNNLSFYVNGSMAYSEVLVTDMALNDYQWSIGASWKQQLTIFQYFFGGLIDEVGLWNRALTPTEVTELFNSGSGLAYPFGLDWPVIDNSTYNFSSAKAGENQSGWNGGNENISITTLDTTPTIRFNTIENAYCRLYTQDWNWTGMGNDRNCSTTGTTGHVCTLSVADEFIGGGSKSLYVGCIEETYVNETINSTSGALAVWLEIPSTLNTGIFDDSYANVSLSIDQGSFFRVWANHSYDVNSSSVYPDGYCNLTADLVVGGQHDFPGDITICDDAACDYSNYSVVMSHDLNGYIEDKIVFSICHHSNTRKDAYLTTNCSGTTYTIDADDFPVCPDVINYSITSTDCNSTSSVQLDFWSAETSLNKAFEIRNYIAFDRLHNHTNQAMVWNATLGLFLMDDWHHYHNGSTHNVSVDCYSNVSGVVNQTNNFSIETADLPPIAIIGSVWDWFTGWIDLTGNPTMKYPLVSGVNVTSFCQDSVGVANMTVMLNYSNGTNIYKDVFSDGDDTVFGRMTNLTQNNFSVDTNFLDGTYGYVFKLVCTDTANQSTSVSEAFDVVNEPPVVSWTDTSPQLTSSVPVTFNFTFSDDEGETGKYFIFINNTNMSSPNITTSATGYVFNLPQGTYNVSVKGEDSFFNSSSKDLIVTYSEACIPSITGVKNNGRYLDNVLNINMSCSNNVTLTSCSYKLQYYTAIAIDDCSDFNLTLLYGKNLIDFNMTGNGVSVQRQYINVFARGDESGLASYIVLIVLLVAVGLITMFYHTMQEPMILGVLLGGVIVVVGFYAYAFSIIAGVAIWILAFLVLIRSVFT